MTPLSITVKQVLARVPRTEAELDEITEQIDAIIRALEAHQIDLRRAWLRAHPKREGRERL
jgi:hypothetical protein